MSRRLTVVTSALLLLPVAASANPSVADVSVDVRVVGGLELDSESWIEFCPDRGAYVALYATFSDGSMLPVFPAENGMSHWVNEWETRAVPLVVPSGVCLTDVHAVASLEWFDPTEGWIASAPAPEHRVVLASAGPSRHPAWGFVVGWSGSRPGGHEHGETSRGEPTYASGAATKSSIGNGASGELQGQSRR